MPQEGGDNYTDDAAWDRRHKHQAVQRSRDFTFLPGHVPIAPNADERMCGKKQWERRMQQWRGLLKCVIKQSAQD